MGKLLSSNAPKPRTRFPFPGYPTVAAAGLYLCLSAGCTPGPGLADTTNAGGSRTGGTTGAGGATSTGGSGTVDTTNTGGYLAGGKPEPFDEIPMPPPDAGAPDVLPPAPDADTPDVMEPPAAQDADLAPTWTDPTGGGGAPSPH